MRHRLVNPKPPRDTLAELPLKEPSSKRLHLSSPPLPFGGFSAGHLPVRNLLKPPISTGALLLLLLLLAGPGPFSFPALAMDSFSSDFDLVGGDSFGADSQASFTDSFGDAFSQEVVTGETYWQDQPVTTLDNAFSPQEEAGLFSSQAGGEEFSQAEADSPFAAEIVQEQTQAPASSVTILPNGDASGVSNQVDYSRWNEQINQTRLTTQFAPFATLTNQTSSSSLTVPAMSKQLTRTSAGTLPTSYDQRGYDTPVKNQEPYNLCWAFSLLASLEHSLKLSGYGDFDLSEEHLAYYFSHRSCDPLGNTPNDYNLRLSSRQNAYRGLGNPLWAALHLSTWSGAVLEEKAPYPTDETHTQIYSQTTATQVSPYDADVYLKDAYFFDEFSTNTAKRIIYDHGSLCTALRMYDAYLNPLTNAYCCVVDGQINHDVLLVGWDDAYPKENFLPEAGVTRDGAFIAKNSWGSSWGENGYFYISYESKGMREAVCATAIKEPAYPNNYFYDGTGRLDGSTLLQSGTATAALANVFVAKAGGGLSEALGEVVICDYSHQNQYGIQIYTDLTDPTDPTSGIRAYAQPLSYDSLYAGIKTVSLPEDILLKPGSLFSVVLMNQGEEPITYLMDESGDLSDGILHFTNATAPGQSFRFDATSRTWIDLGDSPDGRAPTSSARIKVHTRTLG